MKKQLFIILGALHLVYILVTNLYTSYTTYCDYYDKKVDSCVQRYSNACLGNLPLRYYAMYSGNNAGYGYFAPSVRSRSTLQCLYGSEEITPEFSSNEAALRYDNLVGSLIENINSEKEPVYDWEKKVFDTKKRYNELVLRNIAAKLLNVRRLPPGKICMSLNYANGTSLKDARNGYAVSDTFHKIQELNLTIRQ